MIAPTDDSATQSDIAAKVDIASHCQVIELDDLRDLLEPLLELLDLTVKMRLGRI